MAESIAPSAQAQAHVCAFVDSAQDVPALMASCVQAGVSQGEQVVVIAGPSRLGEVRGAVQGAGQHEAAGQLRLVTWTRMYSHARAGFDPAAALDSLQALAAEACGHPQCRGLRMIEHMEWVISAAGGSPRDIGTYERGVDRLVNGGDEFMSVCMYPVPGLSGELLLDLLAAHPMTMVDGRLVASPYYVGEGAA
jgi:hypothetical protein